MSEDRFVEVSVTSNRNRSKTGLQYVIRSTRLIDREIYYIRQITSKDSRLRIRRTPGNGFKKYMATKGRLRPNVESPHVAKMGPTQIKVWDVMPGEVELIIPTVWI